MLDLEAIARALGCIWSGHKSLAKRTQACIEWLKKLDRDP